MPALIAAAILSGAEMEGPIVATIFARLMYLTFVSCGAGLRAKTHCLCGRTRETPTCIHRKPHVHNMLYYEYPAFKYRTFARRLGEKRGESLIVVTHFSGVNTHKSSVVNRVTLEAISHLGAPALDLNQ